MIKQVAAMTTKAGCHVQIRGRKLWPFKTLKDNEEHDRLGLLIEELQSAAWRKIVSKLQEQAAKKEQGKSEFDSSRTAAY